MFENLLISLFCSIDDFCTTFQVELDRFSLCQRKRYLTRTTRMHLSEIMTIVIAFHYSKMRTFKDFYLAQHSFLQRYFPRLVSYHRFVELMPRTVFPLFCYLASLLKPCSGISFVDSTILSVCHIRRASSHKTFKRIASKGKTSTGWFFGLKLHLVINENGELLSLQLTDGSTHDLIPLHALTRQLFGLLFGDKGYLSAKKFRELYQKGIKLVTRIRSNMKNKLLLYSEKLLLRARGVIESVHNRLKYGCQIEHHRHRSFINFLANLFGGLIGYQLDPKKPSLHLSPQQKLELSMT
jgi:hypothetical protein